MSKKERFFMNRSYNDLHVIQKKKKKVSVFLLLLSGSL